MKTCQACTIAADDDAKHCAGCGEASWCAAPAFPDGGSTEPASPVPSDPVGEPDTIMPRHQRRRR